MLEPTPKTYHSSLYNGLLSVLVLASVIAGIVINGNRNIISIIELSIYATTSLVLIVYISRREAPKEHDHRWWVIIVCWSSVLHVAFYEYPDVMNSWPVPCLITANIVGDISVAYLRSSFSILPARRIIREGWLYGIVRHPIYATYIFADIYYVSLVPSIRNGAIATIGIASFYIRARLEESLLMKDSSYVVYAQRVRYRFFPGLM